MDPVRVLPRLGNLLGAPSTPLTDARSVGAFSSLVLARQVFDAPISCTTPSRHLRSCRSCVHITSVGYLDHGITRGANKIMAAALWTA